MAAKVAQYVTVIDRSNKVIGNSKQFKDVFREAKAAYQERKATIKAQRKAREEEELQKALRAVTLQEEAERSTIRPHGQRRHASHRSANPEQYYEYSPSPRSSGHTTPHHDRPRQMSLGEFNEQVNASFPSAYDQPRRSSHNVPGSPQAWDDYDPAARGLVRARTDLPLERVKRPHPARAQSADEVDLDLAYGEFCPESLVVTSEEQKEKELKSLVTRCKGLLEEADCAGHSAKAIIAHLQKNPDTLAAVGLTLAEISAVASKMAPGAMGIIAKSAPAVMALLVSPQFLIAVGVSVGVTVIAIGGYKIVKRIQEKAVGEEKEQVDEAIDVRELDHIERWRRGIPESSHFDDGATVFSGTSVEGEFITPVAARSMGHLPTKSVSGRSKSVRKPKDLDKDKDKESKKGERKKHRRHRSDDDSSSVVSRDSVSTVKRSTTKTAKDRSSSKASKPSPLSRMFSHGTSVRE